MAELALAFMPQYLLFGTLKKTSLSCLPCSSLWSLTALNSSWHTAIWKEQLMLNSLHPFQHTHTHYTKHVQKNKRIYRIYRRNIGDSFSLSATCRSRGGDIIEVTPSTHTAGGWSGSSPLGASWHRWLVSPASPLATKTKERLTLYVVWILVRLPLKWFKLKWTSVAIHNKARNGAGANSTPVSVSTALMHETKQTVERLLACYPNVSCLSTFPPT